MGNYNPGYSRARYPDFVQPDYHAMTNDQLRGMAAHWDAEYAAGRISMYRVEQQEREVQYVWWWRNGGAEETRRAMDKWTGTTFATAPNLPFCGPPTPRKCRGCGTFLHLAGQMACNECLRGASIAGRRSAKANRLREHNCLWLELAAEHTLTDWCCEACGSSECRSPSCTAKRCITCEANRRRQQEQTWREMVTRRRRYFAQAPYRIVARFIKADKYDSFNRVSDFRAACAVARPLYKAHRKLAALKKAVHIATRKTTP